MCALGTWTATPIAEQNRRMRVRTLLIAFLLAMFSLYPTVLAGHAITTTKVEQMALAAGADAAEHDADDGFEVNAGIEELSDFLPAALAMRSTSFTATVAPSVESLLPSIYLPNKTPPPRV